MLAAEGVTGAESSTEPIRRVPVDSAPMIDSRSSGESDHAVCSSHCEASCGPVAIFCLAIFFSCAQPLAARFRRALIIVSYRVDN